MRRDRGRAALHVHSKLLLDAAGGHPHPVHARAGV